MGAESTKKKQDTCSALEHSMISSLLPYKFQEKRVGGTTNNELIQKGSLLTTTDILTGTGTEDANPYQATEIFKN
jgi:hypothetical protein